MERKYTYSIKKIPVIVVGILALIAIALTLQNYYRYLKYSGVWYYAHDMDGKDGSAKECYTSLHHQGFKMLHMKMDKSMELYVIDGYDLGKLSKEDGYMVVKTWDNKLKYFSHEKKESITNDYIYSCANEYLGEVLEAESAEYRRTGKYGENWILSWSEDSYMGIEPEESKVIKENDYKYTVDFAYQITSRIKNNLGIFQPYEETPTYSHCKVTLRLDENYDIFSRSIMKS